MACHVPRVRQSGVIRLCLLRQSRSLPTFSANKTLFGSSTAHALLLMVAVVIGASEHVIRAAPPFCLQRELHAVSIER